MDGIKTDSEQEKNILIDTVVIKEEEDIDACGSKNEDIRDEGERSLPVDNNTAKRSKDQLGKSDDMNLIKTESDEEKTRFDTVVVRKEEGTNGGEFKDEEGGTSESESSPKACGNWTKGSRLRHRKSKKINAAIDSKQVEMKEGTGEDESTEEDGTSEDESSPPKMDSSDCESDDWDSGSDVDDKDYDPDFDFSLYTKKGNDEKASTLSEAKGKAVGKAKGQTGARARYHNQNGNTSLGQNETQGSIFQQNVLVNTFSFCHINVKTEENDNSYNEKGTGLSLVTADQTKLYLTDTEVRTTNSSNAVADKNETSKCKFYNSQTKERKVRKDLQCDICFKKFPRPYMLRDHKDQHKGEKRHKCKKCNRRFYTLSYLRSHMVSHTVPSHKCNICGMLFLHKFSIKHHIRAVHEGERRKQCDLCGKRFYCSSDLNQHYVYHTGERKHKCNVCGQRFFRSHDLTIHKSKHTGEKKYMCDFCGDKFNILGRLRQHVRKHTNEKPYKCDKCDRCFSQISSRKRHYVTHSKDKPYQCDICQMKFTQKGSVSRHKKTAHS